MTDRLVYATLIESIFGLEAVSFDTSKTHSNNVIGAIASTNGFSEFKANFTARLHRLNVAIETNSRLRATIINIVNQIADPSNWDGAYAELSALDYFLSHQDTSAASITLDVTVSATETLGAEMGMTNANHDLRLPAYGVSMDTKLLSDKIVSILVGIFKDVLKSKGIAHLLIVPSYPPDQEYALYQNNRAALLNELITATDVETRPTKFTSTIIPELSYQFAWEAGVYMSEKTYDPNTHAKNHHRLLFSHAKKFSKVEPSVIVFVHFPWSGEKLYMDSLRKTFFREVGNLFFDSYLGKPDLAASILQSFKTTISAADVTKHLSGIVYLEDQAVTAKDPNQVNVDASYIWNSNAVYPLANLEFDRYLQSRGALNLSPNL